MLNKKYLIDITREVLNHMESEYLRSDFTGWCEAASSIVNYILSNYTDITEFYIASGTFDGNGHEWVVANGEIIDPTVDQFGDSYSIYSARLYKELHCEECIGYKPLMFDDWENYINELFCDTDRMDLWIEE